MLKPDEVRRRLPTLTPGEDEVAVFDPNGGFARPEETVLAHTELATRAGADLHHGERVTGWSARGDSVQVTTDRGTYTADKLVLCPGAWAPELLADLGIPLVIERQVMHWFQPTGDLNRFLPDRHPVWIWEAPEIVTYGFPAQDGEHNLKLAFAKRPPLRTRLQVRPVYRLGARRADRRRHHHPRHQSPRPDTRACRSGLDGTRGSLIDR